MIIGEDCKDVPVEEALNYVHGFCIGNDVSARRWQVVIVLKYDSRVTRKVVDSGHALNRLTLLAQLDLKLFLEIK